MIATVTEVEVQTGNQLNVSVVYSNEETGFNRKQIFTIPASDVKRLSDSKEFEKMVVEQGKEFANIEESKGTIENLVGTEFEIK